MTWHGHLAHDLPAHRHDADATSFHASRKRDSAIPHSEFFVLLLIFMSILKLLSI